MTLLEIEAFQNIIKYGNFSAAAEKMFISQPALSRRIQSLETELGCELFTRQQGQRIVRLTVQGRNFQHIALRYQKIIQEIDTLVSTRENNSLAVAGVSTFNHCVLPYIVDDFLALGYKLQIYSTVSETSYYAMEQGFFDLTFMVSQDFTIRQPKGLLMTPAFSTRFCLACREELPNENGVVKLHDLPREREIDMRYCSDFMSWHSEHFDESIPPYMTLDDIASAPGILTGDRWLFASYYLGQQLAAEGAHIYYTDEEPPRLVVYSLTYNSASKNKAIVAFLSVLNRHLKSLPGEDVISFLS